MARLLRMSWHPLWVDDEVLAEHRDRMARRLIVLATVMSLGLWLYQLINRRMLLVLLLTLVSIFLLLNIWALERRGRPLVPYSGMILAVAVSACFATYYQGYYGVFWSFPILFGIYFMLPRRQATAMATALIVAMTVITADVVGLPPALRALASLALTLFMITAVLGIIAELQQAMKAQAITDPLTGAFNRRHLQAELARLQPPEVGQPASHSLLAIDIDHFKTVNDRFGHSVGDAVLRQLVDSINQRKRASDLLFRTGGEEFMLLLFRTQEAQAFAIAESLRERLQSQPCLPDGGTVTVSIGVHSWNRGETVDQWLARADQALYEAKRGGRNRVNRAADSGWGALA